jgi:hypothetical protein
MSCFGSQTKNGTTKITFLVLNDECNKLVTSSDSDQLLYVATGPSLERSALALANEDEAIPFFQAPKKSKKTRDIFYVGHWKSVYYERYQPPINFMGTPCQIVIGLRFVRYDETLDTSAITLPVDYDRRKSPMPMVTQVAIGTSFVIFTNLL